MLGRDLTGAYLQLLVSIRSPEEAEQALLGGAAILDCKEPAHGSLGRASDTTWIEIAHRVPASVPVSVALGELCEAIKRETPPSHLPIAWAKVGFAGERGSRGWQDRFAKLSDTLSMPLIPAAYADADLAGAPPLEDILELALACRSPALLVDTATKNGKTLWDFLSTGDYLWLRTRLLEKGIALVLAGSLGAAAIERLAAIIGATSAIGSAEGEVPLGGGYRELLPNVIAIRGAACESGARTSRICAERVRQMSDQLASLCGQTPRRGGRKVVAHSEAP